MLELELQSVSVAASPRERLVAASPYSFDVSKNFALVPAFHKSEVDSVALERIANILHWPRNVWTILLHCRLSSKAQEVCASLPLDNSLSCNKVEAAILRVYELMSEAYRQPEKKSCCSIGGERISAVRGVQKLYAGRLKLQNRLHS